MDIFDKAKMLIEKKEKELLNQKLKLTEEEKLIMNGNNDELLLSKVDIKRKHTWTKYGWKYEKGVLGKIFNLKTIDDLFKNLDIVHYGEMVCYIANNLSQFLDYIEMKPDKKIEIDQQFLDARISEAILVVKDQYRIKALEKGWDILVENTSKRIFNSDPIIIRIDFEVSDYYMENTKHGKIPKIAEKKKVLEPKYLLYRPKEGRF